jgi:hypothetical protein
LNNNKRASETGETRPSALKINLTIHPFQFGAESNQAIMLVTDGVPYTYENIFQEFNQPHKPVRVFTYLIGREISDLDAAKWMACDNKGEKRRLK